jgi:hypothetical protein
MAEQIKSGREIIADFFSDLPSLEGTNEKTVNRLIELYEENKFTDTNIQNALEEIKQEAIKPKKLKNNE